MHRVNITHIPRWSLMLPGCQQPNLLLDPEFIYPVLHLSQIENKHCVDFSMYTAGLPSLLQAKSIMLRKYQTSSQLSLTLYSTSARAPVTSPSHVMTGTGLAPVTEHRRLTSWPIITGAAGPVMAMVKGASTRSSWTEAWRGRARSVLLASHVITLFTSDLLTAARTRRLRVTSPSLQQGFHDVQNRTIYTCCAIAL